ncbi:MAG: B12-binding domain-containing radical SAM protein [Candidatus Methanofastidiosia archaeon]
MKVLLIDPPKKIWEMMGDCCSPPLGLSYLAAMLEQHDIPVELIDCNGMGVTWKDLPERIKKTSPDLVGTGAMTPLYGRAVKMVKLVKEIDPDITTVVGGSHATFTFKDTLREVPEIDIVVRGEGEETIVEIVRCLEKDSDLKDVKGIAYRRDKNIIITERRPPVDVNSLPLPAYHLLPMEKYRFEFLEEFSTLLTSRGCPFSCTFCSEWDFWGRPWRPRNPESVGEEMELVNRKYKRKSVWFGDDCFNVDYNHIKGICEQIQERDLDVQWFYQGRADFLIKHKDLLPLMRKTGNIMTQIGIEASTDEELNRMDKGITTDQVREAVNLMKEHDIISQGLIIVGTFDDTTDSILHKIKYMKSLKIDFPIFTMFTPFPGSKVHKQAKKEGLIEDFDFDHFDMAYPVMPTKELNRKQLFKWYGECFREYYFDPLQILVGILSKNKFKRAIWRHMFYYGLKQIYKMYFGRSTSWH